MGHGEHVPPVVQFFQLFYRMNLKWLPVIFIVLISLAIIFIRKASKDSQSNKATKERIVNRNRGFDRRISYIKYSRHAQCRMDCRQISQAEVKEIMTEGKINYKKSDLKSAGCPRYALEGRTTDEQRVRIIFAQCDDSTVVVTVIDLDKEHICNCEDQ